MQQLFKPVLVLLLILTPSTVSQFPESLTANALSRFGFQDGIPAATEPCTDEEAKWWQELRDAGSEFAAASRRKEQAVRDARSLAHQRGRVLGDGEDGLSRKERDKLEADLESARQNYARLLRFTQEKSYRVPISDSGHAIVLYGAAPNYTEKARRNKTMGKVRLRVEFGADGAIGAIEVLHGIGDGLDEAAADGIRRMVFLPVTRDHVFVTVSKAVEVEFNLR